MTIQAETPEQIAVQLKKLEASPEYGGWRAWLVVIIATLYFAYEFMEVNMFNSLGDVLYKAYHLTDMTQLGYLSAAYSYAVVLCLFPAGVLLDRFSTRRIILYAMAFCVGATFCFSQTHELWQAIFCRAVTGVAGSFCLLSCVRLGSRWFPARKMALVVGVIVTIAMLGALLAQAPLRLAVSAWGWRQTLMNVGFIGVGFLLAIYFLVRDHPKAFPSEWVFAETPVSARAFFKAVGKTVRNGQNWYAGLFASLLNLPIFLLGANWGALYLTQARRLSSMEAGYVTMALFLGMMVGSPTFGWCSDRLRRRKLPMLLGGLLSVVAILVIMYAPHLGAVSLMVAFFVLGFAISAQVLAYPLVSEGNPSELTGASEGIASLIIMAGGFLIPVFPMLLGWHWSHVTLAGIPFYSVSDFRCAMLTMPVAFVVAVAMIFLLKETHCRSYEERLGGK